MIDPGILDHAVKLRTQIHDNAVALRNTVAAPLRSTVAAVGCAAEQLCEALHPTAQQLLTTVRVRAAAAGDKYSKKLRKFGEILGIAAEERLERVASRAQYQDMRMAELVRLCCDRGVLPADRTYFALSRNELIGLLEGEGEAPVAVGLDHCSQKLHRALSCGERDTNHMLLQLMSSVDTTTIHDPHEPSSLERPPDRLRRQVTAQNLVRSNSCAMEPAVLVRANSAPPVLYEFLDALEFTTEELQAAEGDAAAAAESVAMEPTIEDLIAALEELPDLATISLTKAKALLRAEQGYKRIRGQELREALECARTGSYPRTPEHKLLLKELCLEELDTMQIALAHMAQSVPLICAAEAIEGPLGMHGRVNNLTVSQVRMRGIS